MKKHFFSQYILTILVIFTLSCKQEEPRPAEGKDENRRFSTNYFPPVFLVDQRAEKIKSIASELQKMMEEHAKERNIPGIAYGIVVDDELVLASATGLMKVEENVMASTRSSFRIASMSKSFTAMAIMKLRDEGKLSLNDPVHRYIPELAKIAYLTKDSPDMTLENLLTMTAGFPEDNPWGDRQLDEPDQMLIDLFEDGISFSNPPSYDFEYSNTGYALLGYVISRVSGMPYQDYIHQNILIPLGMHETFWEYDKVPKDQLVLGYRRENGRWLQEPLLHDGIYGAMGGLITSIEDFSKYVSYHLSAWPPRNEDHYGPLERSSLREMQTPKYAHLYATAKDYNQEPCAQISGYGYGLGISTDCEDLKRVGHGGALPGFGSDYRFYPEYGIGIMAFCNLTYTAAYPRDKIEKLLFETLKLEPRRLPVSEILAQRKEQVIGLIQTWNEVPDEFLAENFYLDFSREYRKKECEEIFSQAGEIKSIAELIPENQLRGTFEFITEKGKIRVFFTLTPEKEAKLQELDLRFEPTGGV